jgi:hypothetical protein
VQAAPFAEEMQALGQTEQAGIYRRRSVETAPMAAQAPGMATRSPGQCCRSGQYQSFNTTAQVRDGV